MDESKKLFVSREPNDDEITLIRDLIIEHDIKERLKENFVYIILNGEQSVEVISVPDGSVVKTAKEYYINHKQAIQLIYDEPEIDQDIKELQYWSNIGGYKKYVAVIAEAKMKGGMEKVYADFAIYAKDIVEAGITMTEFNFEEYLYLEDVDEEKEKE